MDKSENSSIDINSLANCLRDEVKTLHPLSDDCCIYRVPQDIRMANESFYTPKLVSIGPLHHGREELKAMEEHKVRLCLLPPNHQLDTHKDSHLEAAPTTHGKMDKSENSSIDINSLANCLRDEVKTLHPLSDDCCIYRVPQDIRMANESFYTPKLVSIGPLHHGREELKAMEEHKVRSLEHFLQQTQVSLEDFLIFIKNKEEKLRNCYAETIALESRDFVKMILLDAVFLIEVLRRYSNLELRGVDRIFTKPHLLVNIRLEILSLENQLPLFILEDLFKLAGFSSLNRLCLLPPNHQLDTHKDSHLEAAPSITELHQAGIKFKLGSAKHLLDIRFSKGTLEIPKLTIGVMAKHLFKNLQIFERLHCDTNYVNEYVVFLNGLVNTSKDAEILIQNGIIENRTWDSEGVSTLFQQLSENAIVRYYGSYYWGIAKDLKSYCKSPWHKWRAILKQNYFNTPWASISVIAAAIIIILTSVQTVCSVIAL
ncbi:hypothetical protein JRO89_XS10G0040700 [Xanthoceras sorbifolium]|uniref:Uncharacterized protein n=1 Tax=Xanthoceras sorbifolium TaxID=99658 RepID=A0ABQ8HHJ4_9ROSI|nr:hypothetical protein JRO89_XS10G0040700 [Xanthoceras sorbifolium]